MTDSENEQPKNVGRRRLIQILTGAGGLAAAGLLPKTWSTPVADVLGASASAQPAPSPSPTTSASPSPSVSVSVSTRPPTPTPAPIAASPPFTG